MSSVTSERIPYVFLTDSVLAASILFRIGKEPAVESALMISWSESGLSSDMAGSGGADGVGRESNVSSPHSSSRRLCRRHPLIGTALHSPIRLNDVAGFRHIILAYSCPRWNPS